MPRTKLPGITVTLPAIVLSIRNTEVFASTCASVVSVMSQAEQRLRVEIERIDSEQQRKALTFAAFPIAPPDTLKNHATKERLTLLPGTFDC